MKGKGIGLNPGHHGTVGAVGINKEITEEFFADMQATIIKKRLDNYGLLNQIVLQNGNDLSRLGRMAAGFDMFLLLHFNAAIKKELYACFLYGANPRKTSLDFGRKLMINLRSQCGCNLYNGDGLMKVMHVSALNSANKTNCPIVGLIESEFIDDETDIDDFKLRVIKKSNIIADVIIAHFREKS